jgi:hypothetical protein
MNTTNLKLLVNYLKALPKHYSGFDMGRYNTDMLYCYRPDSDIKEKHCGSSACAIGHLAYVEGMPEPLCGEEWEEYGARVMGLDNNEGAYVFLFHGAWDSYDNSIEGFIFRAEHLLNNLYHSFDDFNNGDMDNGFTLGQAMESFIIEFNLGFYEDYMEAKS